MRPFSTAAAEEDHHDDDDLLPSSSSSYALRRRSGVRNVAIVAHVDHGKTTLVDELLKSTMTGGGSAAEDSDDGEGADASAAAAAAAAADLDRLMDSGELEKERGITITSKVTRLDYSCPKTGEPTVVNVVDTPGHADFAGEVDRILSMVDGVVLVVDAAEGPKSQTKYVLGRALSLGLRPIAVLNKADRSDARARIESGETESELLDLFDNLGADEEQMDYTTLYASARGGWCAEDDERAFEIAEGGDGEGKNSMRVLLDAIMEAIPAPAVHSYAEDDDDDNDDENDAPRPAEDFASQPFSIAATTVGYDQYLGRTCTGRIYSGKIEMNDTVALLRRSDDDGDGDERAAASDNAAANNPQSLQSKVSGLFVNRGVSRASLDPPFAVAGDIVTLAGVPDAIAVGDTLTSASDPVPRPVETPPLAPPTLSCVFGANNGPLVGKEGSIVTSSRVRSRLMDETDNNVTITVVKSETDPEKTVVFGRGELQIGILIEQMRREGYEMIVSPPRIVTKDCPRTGQKLEPFEEVIVDVDAEYSGSVIDGLTGARKGVLVEMRDDASEGKTRLTFEIPSRGLLGYASEMANATRGTAVMHHCFLEDRAHAGPIGTGSEKGKLVSNAPGKANMYALESLSQRGTLFVAPGDEVYPGMVIGESNRSNGDMDVNPVKAKATNNMRTQNKDEKMYLAPPKKMTVEELIGYMEEDEVVEVTPESIRLRKAELDAGVRAREAKAKKKRREALRAEQGKGKKK